jgi:hypothetical protein
MLRAWMSSVLHRHCDNGVFYRSTGICQERVERGSTLFYWNLYSGIFVREDSYESYLYSKLVSRDSHACMNNHVRFGIDSIIVKAHRIDAATKSNLA